MNPPNNSENKSMNNSENPPMNPPINDPFITNFINNPKMEAKKYITDHIKINTEMRDSVIKKYSDRTSLKKFNFPEVKNEVDNLQNTYLEESKKYKELCTRIYDLS